MRYRRGEHAEAAAALSALEQAAAIAWMEWGQYAKWSICDGCGRFRYCRAPGPRAHFLCIECWDQR